MAILTEAMLETAPCRYGAMTFFSHQDLISRSLREYGEWAQLEIDFLTRFVQPGDTVADVGAFLGTHSLALATRVGTEGQVIAFEPRRDFFDILKRNIQQNGCTNILPYCLAASDQESFVAPQEIDLSSSNLGGLTLVDRNATDDGSSGADRIRLCTIDSLQLQHCALLKIDVEGMESRVLQGAQETLRRARPAVFAECNSVHNGLAILEFARSKEYLPFLLIVSAYNPSNYRQNTLDIFGGARETGLLLVHESDTAAREYLSSTPPHTLVFPIHNPDDLVLGLIKKPQYKTEILSHTEAAKYIGVEFWANETELATLHATNKTELANSHSEIAALRTSVQALDSSLKEKEQRNQDLAEQLQSVEQGRVALQGELSRTRHDLSRAHDELQTLQYELENERQIRSGMESSKSWYITQPLRRFAAFFRNARTRYPRSSSSGEPKHR